MAGPTRSERFKPAELISLAAVVAVFVGLVVFLSTRTFEIAVVSTGAAFIIALVILAMLALAAGPIGREKDLRGGDPTAPAAPPTGPGEKDDPAP